MPITNIPNVVGVMKNVITAATSEESRTAMCLFLAVNIDSATIQGYLTCSLQHGTGEISHS